MEHWRSARPPGVMTDVQYEGLVADLDGHARATKAWRARMPALPSTKSGASDQSWRKIASVRQNLRWFPNGALPSVRARQADGVSDCFLTSSLVHPSPA
jgi:hypothetical protein